MSIRLMAQLWDNGDPDLSGSKLLVVLCLADHSNDDGVCWPSINRLAERTRIDRRNIMRHLQSLEAMGYLEITRTPGRPNRYTVHATRDDITTSGKTITSGNSVTPTRGKTITGTRGKTITTPVVKSPPESSYNPNYEPPIQSSSNGVAEDALINPDLTQALNKWQAVFTGTPSEAAPPVSMFHKWLAWYGPDVLCHMIGQAKDKGNPTGWMYTTYDNWRKDGEVAPYVMRQINDAKLAAAPIVTKVLEITWGDGSTEEREVSTRG